VLLESGKPSAKRPERSGIALRSLLPEGKVRCYMRGALLWLLGIPIPVIILLYVFHVI